MPRSALSRCLAPSTRDSEDENVPPGLSRLVEQLESCASPAPLTSLRLSGNASEFGDYFVGTVDARRTSRQWREVRWRVLELVGCSKTLTRIDLAGCGITNDSEVRQLCSGLQHSQVLEDLNVSLNRGFGTENGCRELCAVLRGCPRLQLLYLGRVGMQASGLGHIMEALSSADLPLQRLYLWRNVRLGDAGIKLVADFLSNRQRQTSTRLKVLDIGDSRMSVRGAAVLSEALQADSGLEILLIGETQRPGAIGAVLRPLIRSPSSFAISGIGVMVANEEGLGAIVAEMLACNHLLRALYLDRSEFSPGEWAEIFKSLRSNTGLQLLSLASTRGIERAFQGLVDLMCGRSAPLNIVLTGTVLETQGMHVLIMEALKREPKARRLFLLDSNYPLPLGCFQLQGSKDSPSEVLAWETKSTDIHLLPHQVQVFMEDLKAAPPTLVGLPPLANVEEFGDYFVETNNENRTRTLVRLRVFHLIGYCTSLTVIDLDSCGIQREAEVEALCTGLQTNSVLTALYLDWNTGFGSEFGCEQIAMVLKRSGSINRLSLLGIGVGKRAFERIIGALNTNTDLAIAQLNVCFNPNLGAEIIGTFLQSHAGRELGELKMQGIGMTVQGAKQLARAFLQSPWVYKLIVGDEEQWLEDGDGPLATFLRPFIHHEPTTSSLYLTLGLIGARERGLAKVVGEMLLSYPVWELGLDRSDFSRAEWCVLFRSLQSTEKLAVLSLEECRNLENLFQDIMDLVKKNPALQLIQLNSTALEQTGLGAEIRAALRANALPETGRSADGTMEDPDGSNTLVYRADSDVANEYVLAEEHLPLGLRNLIHELGSGSAPSPLKVAALAKHYPLLSPLRANVKDFGNYFNPEYNIIKREQRLEVRMGVLSLIAYCRTLSEIDLRGCCISGSQEVKTLCQGLHSTLGLQSLYLDGNEGFGSELGCQQLSTIVRDSRTLQILSLGYQRMVSRGLFHIIQALLQNGSSALHTLSIFGNLELGDIGVELVSGFLESNSHACSVLKEIRMFGVGMGYLGAECLAKSLAGNRFLKTLHIGERQLVRTPGVNQHSSGVEGFRDGSRMAPHVQQPVTCFLNHLVVHCGSSTEETSIKASRNESLTCLHITSTVEQGLGESISFMLKHMSLEGLGIHETRLSTLEWRTVFNSLQNHKSTLVSLFLEDAGGLGFVLKDLLKLFDINMTIRNVELSGTALERTGADAIVRDALRRNAEREVYLSILREHFKLVNPKAGRLFLCGPAFAGKTSLWTSFNLCLKNLPPAHKFWRDIDGSSLNDVSSYLSNFAIALDVPRRTRGIEIHAMEYANDLQVSVWDLAGQAEFHAIHQCLFPDTNYPCVFLFVFNVVNSTTGKLKEDMGRALREELCYWLRFVASNSSSVTILPQVCVILTHFDELGDNMSKENIADTAKQAAVNPLKKQFQGVLDLSDQVHVVGLRGHFGFDGIPRILQHIFVSFCELLSRLPQVSQACGHVSKALRQHMCREDAQPIMTLEEFKELCLGGGFEDVTENIPVEQAVTAVISYLHSIGDIIFFKTLGCVVVSPHWFAHCLLGQLMNPEIYRQELCPYSEEGRVNRPILERFLLACLKNTSTGFFQSQNDIKGHLLIEIMLHLNLCCKVGFDSYNEELFFVPTLLDDLNETAWRGERQVEWPAKDDSKRKDSTCLYFGRRLQCQTPTTTFLAPGFFSRFQVGFRKLPHEAQEKPLYKCDRNLVSWSPDSFEVLIECSGDSDTYVDILVRAFQKTHLQCLEFIEELIRDLRDFCATGCPGVVLSEAILRPECVKNLTLFVHRKMQSVLVEEVKDTVVEKFLKADAATGQVSRALKSVIDHAYTWRVNVKEAGLGPASESVVALLGARESFKLLESCLRICRRNNQEVEQEHHVHDLEAFTSARLRDPELNTEEGLKKALLDWFLSNEEVSSSGPRKPIFPSKDQPSSSDFYPCTNVRRGYRRGLALIISMEKDRPGGAVDRGRLDTLALCTSFQREVLVDCTAKELRYKIKLLAEAAVSKEDDSFLCCVNAHGGTDDTGGHYIVDQEGDKIFLAADVMEPFRRSKQLAGKPKLFFVNACRGPMRHAKSGYEQIRPPAGPEKEVSFLKDLTDWLLVFSTSEHSLSWREETQGSSFVIALVEAIIEHRRTTDVLTIITNVNYMVSSKQTEVRNVAGRLEGRFSQSPVVQHTLRKQLYWKE